MSMAVTSTMMPWARNCVTRAIKRSRNKSVSESLRAERTVAISICPCLRIGTGMGVCVFAKSAGQFAGARYLIAQQVLRLFYTALQVADRVHLRQVQTYGHQRQGDLRGQAGDDHAGAHETRRVDRLH